VDNVCTHPANTAACNDGNACTTSDVCTSGVCTGGAVLVCNDNNACTSDICNTTTGCVYTAIPNCGATGADVGVLQFHAPRNIDNCKKGRQIKIVAKNFSWTQVSGTISLYKDDVLVNEWTNVVFKKRSSLSRSYFYKPANDGGKTVKWRVVIDVPNDPNLSNNTSVTKTTIVKCEKRPPHKGGEGRQAGGAHDNRD